MLPHDICQLIFVAIRIIMFQRLDMTTRRPAGVLREFLLADVDDLPLRPSDDGFMRLELQLVALLKNFVFELLGEHVHNHVLEQVGAVSQFLPICG